MPNRCVKFRAKLGLAYFLFLLLISGFQPAQAGIFSRDKAGKTGAQFLKLGVGARSPGMAEASTAIVSDLEAIYWNPAGLAQLFSSQVTASHIAHFAGLKHNFFAYAQPLRLKENRYVWGVSLTNLDWGPVDLFQDYAKVARIRPQGWALNWALARYLNSFMVGFNLKGIREDFNQWNSYGVAGDLGCIYKTLDEKIGLGMTIQNIGPGMVYGRRRDPLPLIGKLGGSYSLFKDESLRLSSDIHFPIDDEASFHLGAEYLYPQTKRLTLKYRLGFRTNTYSYLDILSAFSCGIGLAWQGINVDYAFIPYGELGFTQRISFLFSFGSSGRFAEIKKDYDEGKRYYREGKLIKAKEKFYNVLNKEPTHEKAAQWINRIQDLLEETVTAGMLYNQGYVLYIKGQKKEAGEILLQATSIDPNHLESKDLLAKISEELKKEEETSQKIKMEKEKERLSAQGIHFYQSKKWPEAIISFEKLIKLVPGDAQGLTYLNKAKKKIALENYTFGLKLYQEENLIEAKKYFNRSLEYNPEQYGSKDFIQKINIKLEESAEKYYLEGLQEYKLGNLEKAIKLWEKTLQMNPGHLKAQKALERQKKNEK